MNDDNQSWRLGWNMTQRDMVQELREAGLREAVYADDDSISIRLNGWKLVLMQDGRWFSGDTSGG